MCNYLEGKTFIKTEEFKIGELIVDVYAYNKLVALFDPMSLIREESDMSMKVKYFKNRKEYIVKNIDSKFIYYVDVKIGKNEYKNNKLLVTEEGIYQLIFSLDCEECERMRHSFAYILTAYRKRHGWTLKKFLELSYSERNFIDVDSVVDERCRARYEDTLALESAGYINLSVLDFYEAPMLEGYPIFDENIDYYLDNIDKAELVHKCVYCLKEDRVIEALTKVMGFTEVYIMGEVLKDINVINIKGNSFMSLHGDEIYCKLISFFKDKPQAAKIFDLMLFEIFRDKDIKNILYKSTVELYNIQQSLSIKYIFAYRQKLSYLVKVYSSEKAIELAKDYMFSLRKKGK